MINQIKHNSPGSVLSQFNPIASLKPKIRKAVNERFILPILEEFFINKGGIDNHSELDPDKLKTEIEFVKAKNFVKTYIYKEIINEIGKKEEKVVFKPKYVITFDEDLANYDEENNIKYGVIRLGQVPILYYILIDLQQLIKFIKTLPEEVDILETSKLLETEADKQRRLVDTVILEKTRVLNSTTNPQERGKLKKEIERLSNLKQESLQGQGGKLRINLAWNTTDDLDLHVETPNGTISYKNKIIENQSIIGELDVDKNAGDDLVSNPQENVNFNNIPLGKHKIFVNFYAQRENPEVSFTIRIIPENGEGRIFNKTVVGKGNNRNVVVFEYKNGELDFNEII